MGTKDKDNIVTNQRIADATRQRAFEMRQNMTPAERRLWSELRTNRLDGWHFRRQLTERRIPGRLQRDIRRAE